MNILEIFHTLCHICFNYHYYNSSLKLKSSVVIRRMQFAIRMTVSFLVGGFIVYGTPLNQQSTSQYLVPVMCILSVQETFGMTLIASYQMLVTLTPLCIFLFVLQKIGLGYGNYLAAESMLLVSSLVISYKCSQVRIS